MCAWGQTLTPCVPVAEAKQWANAKRVIDEMHSLVRDWDIRVYNSVLGVAARQLDAERALRVRTDGGF